MYLYLWFLLSARGESDFSYVNPNYKDGLTAEELEEIQRVSQVPFNQYGSVSHLLQVRL